MYLSPQQYSSKEKRCLVGGGPHTDEVLLPQKEEVAKTRWCGKQSWETSPGRLSVHIAFCYYLLWDLTWMGFLEHRPPSLPSYHKPCLTAFPTSVLRQSCNYIFCLSSLSQGSLGLGSSLRVKRQRGPEGRFPTLRNRHLLPAWVCVGIGLGRG